MNDVATPVAAPANAKAELPSFDDCLNIIETFRKDGSGMKARVAMMKEHAAPLENTDTIFAAYIADETRWGGEVDWVDVAATKKKPATKVKTLVNLSPVNDQIIKGLKLFHEIMGHPFRAAFAIWALNKKDDWAHIAAQPERFNYDKFRGDVAEAFGQALLAKGGKSNMLADPRNNHFVTKTSDGKWQVLSDDDMTKLIQRQGKNGPNVFVTANHAFLEDISDITPTVDEYGDLITVVNEINEGRLDAGKVVRGVANGGFKTKEFAADKKASHIVCYNQISDKPNQTLIVVALNTRENNFLNLGSLFHRLHEIEQANKSGVKTDKFKYTSPIARMMVSTILRAIVQDPLRITDGKAGTPPSFVNGDEPVMLRKDAAEVVRNVQFHGFSKGGNDFRDGMRLLARTLNGKSGEQALFQLPSDTQNPPRDILKDIVSNISVSVQSMNEKEMDPWYQSRGVSMTYFTNRHDTIAVPPKHAPEEAGDMALIADGQQGPKAHDPSAITFNLSHPYILQHFQCALASLVGKPALRFIIFDKGNDPKHPHYSLTLRTAPGTTDAMMKITEDTLNDAFAKAGLVHKGESAIRLQKREGTSGGDRYELISAKGDDHLLNPQTLRKMNEVVWDLSRDAEQPVVVSSALNDPGLSILSTNCMVAKRGYQDHPAIDWKSQIKSTVAEFFDLRMARINEFMGGQEPVEKAPQMREPPIARSL